MILIREFCNHPDEWHALILGWGEAMYLRQPKFKMGIANKNPIENEYWYYTSGLALGTFTWIAVAVGLKVLFC